MAAMDLFRKKGVEATTVEEIVGRAGVSKGTYFFHFPAKERVFGTYVEVLAQDLLPSLPEWLALPPLEGIRAARDAITASAEADRNFIPYVAREELFSPDDCQTSPLEVVFLPLVQRAQQAGVLRSDLEARACVYHLLSNYLINLIWAFRLPNVTLADFLNQAMLLAVDGLRPRP